MSSFRTISLLVATILATLALATPVVSTEGVELNARQNLGGLLHGVVGSGNTGVLGNLKDMPASGGALPEAADFGAV